MSADEIFAEIERAKKARADKYPDTAAAIKGMFEAYQRLTDLGWQDAIYCPKDGTLFDSISAGSTGIGNTMYRGEWPDGKYWGFEAGDVWPAHPILFKPIKD